MSARDDDLVEVVDCRCEACMVHGASEDPRERGPAIAKARPRERSDECDVG